MQIRFSVFLLASFILPTETALYRLAPSLLSSQALCEGSGFSSVPRFLARALTMPECRRHWERRRGDAFFPGAGAALPD